MSRGGPWGQVPCPHMVMNDKSGVNLACVVVHMVDERQMCLELSMDCRS